MTEISRPPAGWPVLENTTLVAPAETVVQSPAPVPVGLPSDRGIGAGMLLAIVVLAVVAAGLLAALLLSRRGHSSTTTVVLTTAAASTGHRNDASCGSERVATVCPGSDGYAATPGTSRPRCFGTAGCDHTGVFG